jgi:hypothetical protein
MASGRKWDVCGALLTLFLVCWGQFFLWDTVWAPGRTQRIARQSCRENLRGMYLFFREYSEENDGRLPDGLYVMLAESGWTFLTCPCKALVASRGGADGLEIDYEYRGRGLTWAELQSMPDYPLAFDRPGNHPDGTRCVLLAGGEVRLLREKELQALLDLEAANVHTDRGDLPIRLEDREGKVR